VYSPSVTGVTWARYLHKGCISFEDTKVFSRVKKKNVKYPLYRPGCGPEWGRGITLLFQDLGPRRGWVVSSTLRPHFTPVKHPVPIVQGGWVGPRAGLDKGIISSSPGFDPRTVQFVVSRYTDWATRPTQGSKLRRANVAVGTKLYWFLMNWRL
jgi:hypothetical protein